MESINFLTNLPQILGNRIYAFVSSYTLAGSKQILSLGKLKVHFVLLWFIDAYLHDLSYSFL
jgi:hypothetical protein